MAISSNERAPNLGGVIKDNIKGELGNVWTTLPGIVNSYDADAVTVTVQPAINIPIRREDGALETVALPLLLDVPVIFSGAGGFTVTHPIKKGDECLVSFACRNIDLWWQSGGVQNPFDMRKHDLSDGFAFFRPQSQMEKISDISTDHFEIRNNTNDCKVQITKDGELNFFGKKATFKCPVEIESTLTVKGLITSLTDVVAKAISLFGHKHGGVEGGNSTTTEPQ